MQRLIVRMRGGLGNQLFILAFSYAVASKLKTDCKILIDTREYTSYKIRSFDLLNHLIDNRIEIFDDIKDGNIFYELSREIYHVIQKIIPDDADMLKILCRNGLLYSKRSGRSWIISKRNLSMYIYGYFQDYWIAQEARQEICKSLTLPEIDFNSTKPLIAVSIRCGSDYILKKWPICSSKYFKNGIDEIKKEKYSGRSVRILIFSDDIKVAKKMNFSIYDDVMYIEGRDEFEQLAIMKKCNDFIISNSSFSWWGAFLGKKKESIIIAPEKWYTNYNYTDKTLLFYEDMRIRKI